MLQRIGLRLGLILVHPDGLRRSTANTWRGGPTLACARGVGTRHPILTLVAQVFTIMHTRRSRALLAALALAAFTLGTLPLVAPAASPPSAKKTVPAAKTAGTKKVAAAKTAAKKTAKPIAGYHPHNGPAPADEYFGRLQMSILGVRNKVKDLGLDADTHPEHDKAILGNAI
ncbi:MAG TPA: hypothetical protein VK665_14855, partial [Candidatus Elarobacter sp.]|nr:hypothetical protein [Candidatus Elarobacter sp.]